MNAANAGLPDGRYAGGVSRREHGLMRNGVA